MSTPYRVEYKLSKKGQTICVADGHDGYPRDIITGVIVDDLKRIRTDYKQFKCDISDESQEYGGRQLDPRGNCPADYEYEVDVESNIVVVSYPSIDDKIKVTIDLTKFTPEVMGQENYEIMMDEVQYGFECIDEATLEMIESYGFVVTGVTFFAEEC